MDRLDEFNGIIDKIKSEKLEIEGNEPLLRNRNQIKATANPEKTEEAPGIFNFSKTFLSECSLIVIFVNPFARALISCLELHSNSIIR